MSSAKNRLVAAAVALCALGLAACGSNADTVSKNISKEAEKFNVNRRIVVSNYQGTPIWAVEGRCSFESTERKLDVVCKNKPGDYTKATIGLGDNTSWGSVQLQPINVSEYRTKIILRPEALVPDFDLVTGTPDRPR